MYLLAAVSDSVEFARHEILRFINGLRSRQIISVHQQAALEELLAQVCKQLYVFDNHYLKYNSFIFTKNLKLYIYLIFHRIPLCCTPPTVSQSVPTIPNTWPRYAWIWLLACRLKMGS